MAQSGAPAASGTLERLPIPNLLAYALERQLTGTLQLQAPSGATATIVFRDGWPSKARTSEPAYLGGILHELGLIDASQLNASLAKMATERKLHGRILLEMGVLDAEALVRGLRAQLARRMEIVFAFEPKTTFAYYEGVDGLAGWGGPEVIRADPLPLLWTAVRSSPPWTQVNEAMSRLENGLVARLNPGAPVDRFGLSSQERQLVDLLRQRPMTLQQLIATNFLTPQGTKLLLYALLLTKLVACTAPGPGDFAPSNAPPARASAPPPAAAPAIAPPPPPPPGIATPAASFVPPRSKTPAPMPATRPSQMPPRASAPPPSVALTPELAELRQRIIDRCAALGTQNCFEVLDLPRDAPIPAVQKQYVALARTWHPDRLAPQLFDVRDLCEKVFMRMTEAHATLTDQEKRAAYVASLARGQAVAHAPAAQPSNATLEFHKAEVLMKKRDYATALQHAERAHESDPSNADYLAFLVWLRLLSAGNGPLTPDASQKLMEGIDRALKLNEHCERAYFVRANLYKRLGSNDKAYLDFKRAAEINPHNVDAMREVRLWRMRHEPKATR
jgi:hypothetical protein